MSGIYKVCIYGISLDNRRQYGARSGVPFTTLDRDSTFFTVERLERNGQREQMLREDRLSSPSRHKRPVLQVGASGRHICWVPSGLSSSKYRQYSVLLYVPTRYGLFAEECGEGAGEYSQRETCGGVGLVKIWNAREHFKPATLFVY